MDTQEMPEESVARLEQMIVSEFGVGSRIRLDDQVANRDPIHVGYFTPFSKRLRELVEGVGFDLNRPSCSGPRYIGGASLFRDVRCRGWIGRKPMKEQGFVKGIYQSLDKRALLIYITIGSRQEYLIAANHTDKERPYSLKKWFYSNPELFSETLLEEKIPIIMMRYAFYDV